MKLLKVSIAFALLVSLQIAAAQWLNVPPPVEAKNLMMFTTGVPVVGGTCNTTTAYATQLTDDNLSVHSATSNVYSGQGNYSPGENISVCQVDVEFNYIQAGSISGQYYRVSIFDQSGNDLNTELGVSNVYLSNNSTGWKSFTFSTPVSLSTGTNYSIVIAMSDAEAPFTPTYDASNYFKIGINVSLPALTGAMSEFYANKTRNRDYAYDFGIKIYRIE